MLHLNQNGCNCICVHTDNNDQSMLDKESDLIQNYDMHPKEPSLRECPYDFIILGVDSDREELYTKINQRVDKKLLLTIFYFYANIKLV